MKDDGKCRDEGLDCLHERDWNPSQAYVTKDDVETEDSTIDGVSKLKIILKRGEWGHTLVEQYEKSASVVLLVLEVLI